MNEKITDDSFSSKAIINNEYDYSNVLPTVEALSYLIQFCDQMNKKLTTLVEQDEEKNKQFKMEYKEYMYKHSYGQKFEVYITEKSFNSIRCNSYEDFISAAQGDKLNNINGMTITLCMDFYRGNGNDLNEHENSFIITFKPYDIKFLRKSNYNDDAMDQIEAQIKEIMNKFPIANSIFCNKD